MENPEIKNLDDPISIESDRLHTISSRDHSNSDLTPPDALTCPPVSPNDCGMRRGRTAFSKDQVSYLEKEYLKDNYVTRPRRCQIAAKLNLPEGTIKVWFQNRRMKDKRQKIVGPWNYCDVNFPALFPSSQIFSPLAPLTFNPVLPYFSHPTIYPTLYPLAPEQIPLQSTVTPMSFLHRFNQTALGERYLRSPWTQRRTEDFSELTEIKSPSVIKDKNNGDTLSKDT